MQQIFRNKTSKGSVIQNYFQLLIIKVIERNKMLSKLNRPKVLNSVHILS